MSLNAMNTAVAGLRLTQAQIGLVSQNVANAGTVGYVRRTLDPVTTGPGNNSVASGTISRTFDAAALKQLRLETSGAAYTAVNSGVRTALDGLFGVPGQATALDGLMNGFASALQTLAANPTSAAARSAVIDGARGLAQKIGAVASGVQDLRTAMEAQLSQDTAQASGLLSSIAELNGKIGGSASDGGRADLQDQRDQAINALSALMDVQVVPQRDGSVTVMTGSGVTLVDHGKASALSFDGRGSLTPDASYASDPAERSVGTITATTPGGSKIDLVAAGTIRSGSIAAALELRDGALPQAQRQLDDLAAGLSRAMSDASVTGAAITAGGKNGFDLDLTGLSAGNALTLDLKDPAGKAYKLILVPSYLDPTPTIDPSQTDDPNAKVVSFTIPKPTDTPNPAAIRAAIEAALPPGLTIGAVPGGAAGAVRLLSDGGSGDTTLVGAGASVTQAKTPGDTKNGSARLPLFVDSGRNGGLYTGSFDGGSQLTGFAQRIAINPNVSGNLSSLTAFSATAASGDTTRPQALYDALTQTRRTFSAASAVDGIDAPYSASVSQFAQGIIAMQGAAAASAQDLDEGQGIALATAQSRFASQAGVNIDEEMSRLIELQTAYTANARVLTAARDMIDALLRI